MFDLTGKVIVITGALGLLGKQHVDAVAQYGATPVILDLNQKDCEEYAQKITKQYQVPSLGLAVDITLETEVQNARDKILTQFGKIDVLINNAANNPKVEESKGGKNFSRLENFDIGIWNQDLAVGLTGSFLCSKYFGFEISKNSNGGAIINISSDLGIIAPDQRLYRQEGLPENEQPFKHVTYSVLKSGLIG
mgnify:CR=1 FL=1